MISPTHLHDWIHSMDLDIQIFEAYIFGQSGKVPVVFDPADVALLKTNDPHLIKSVEAAIENYAVTAEWSASLRRDVYLHLFYRAFHASGLLEAALSMEAGAPGLLNAVGLCPDPTDKSAFTRWLYIDRWDVGAQGFIRLLAERSVESPMRRA